MGGDTNDNATDFPVGISYLGFSLRLLNDNRPTPVFCSVDWQNIEGGRVVSLAPASQICPVGLAPPLEVGRRVCRRNLGGTLRHRLLSMKLSRVAFLFAKILLCCATLALQSCITHIVRR